MAPHHSASFPWLGDIAACIRFYTRLPAAGEPERSFAEAQWAAPVSGMVVGLAAGLALLLAHRLGLPAGLAAAIALAAGVLVTGALHEDGLADVADGFGGGTTREDKLAIMKDSRLGTYGTLALTLSLLARWSALAALPLANPALVLWTMMAVHAASRAPVPLFMAMLPAARPGGLSAGVGAIEPATGYKALILGALVLLPLGLGYTLAAALALAILFLCLRHLAMRQIGGQTGDVLGALQQGDEIVLLTLTVIFLT